jgi:tetratricopeptide (TPR) repeat protein
MTVSGQSSTLTAPEHTSSAKQIEDMHLSQPEVMQLIRLNEAEVQKNEKADGDRKGLMIAYSNLGILYSEAGMPFKAEEAMKRTIALLGDGPKVQLADEMAQLAVVHVAMNKVKQAEKDVSGALQLREKVGEPVGIALAESALAGFYEEEGKYAKALDLSEKAYAALANHGEMETHDRIEIRHTLGFALTATGNCTRGIGILQDARTIARDSPELSLPTLGFAEYVLGVGYWRCGDRINASRWLDRGTTDMKADFGWDRALYLSAMQQYARFLRKDGQLEAAVSAEAIVNQAKSVVDANTLADGAQGVRASGFK